MRCLENQCKHFLSSAACLSACLESLLSNHHIRARAAKQSTCRDARQRMPAVNELPLCACQAEPSISSLISFGIKRQGRRVEQQSSTTSLSCLSCCSYHGRTAVLRLITRIADLAHINFFHDARVPLTESRMQTFP